jgi:hypothetical protein
MVKYAEEEKQKIQKEFMSAGVYKGNYEHKQTKRFHN